MADIFRTGASAASRPRDEDRLADRDDISERFNTGSGLLNSKFFTHLQPENESPYIVTLVPYPIWVWPEINLTAQQRTSTGISPVIRPQELQGLNDPTVYSVFLKWPNEGGARRLLGMFIRSRPKGATQWREQIDYRPFTESIDQYGPANNNRTDLYVEELQPSTSDEYQIATRYVWTPDPFYEFLSEIIDGATLPRTQPIMVAELVQNAGFSTSQKNIVHPNLFAYGTFGETDLIEAEERQAIAFASGRLNNKGTQRYHAKFAENVQDVNEEEQKSADLKGKLQVHPGSFFTYADDIDGIIVID